MSKSIITICDTRTVDYVDKVMKLLNENKIMCVATSLNDNPRSSILEYVMINGSIMFMTDAKTIKAGNLAKNSKISLTIMGPWSGKLEDMLYMAANGKVAEANDKERDAYLEVLFERYPEFKQFIKSGDFNNKYFKIVIDTVWFSQGMAPAEVIKY